MLPLSFSDFNDNLILSAEFRKKKIGKYQISQKSAQWESRSSLRTDGLTQISKLITSFRNFGNAPKNWNGWYFHRMPTVFIIRIIQNTEILSVGKCRCASCFIGSAEVYLHSFLKSALLTIHFREQIVCRKLSNLACYNITFWIRSFQFQLILYFASHKHLYHEPLITNAHKIRYVAISSSHPRT